jgi:hypothetical protein
MSTSDTTAVQNLSDEQREALSHLIAKGSTFPDHNGPSGGVTRVKYEHLLTAAPLLKQLLDAGAAPQSTTPQADAAIAAGEAGEAVGEIASSHFVQGGTTVKLFDQSLPVGTKLYAAPLNEDRTK